MWLYAAVSSSPQEATLEDQRQWAKETAVRNGWVIAREFAGVSSGAKGTREILSNLIEELERTPKAARPQRVLMIRIDRVGRLALDCIAAVAQLRKLGVVLHTRQDGDVKLETAMDSLRPIFELVTAEMENCGSVGQVEGRPRTAPCRGQARREPFRMASFSSTGRPFRLSPRRGSFARSSGSPSNAGATRDWRAGPENMRHQNARTTAAINPIVGASPASRAF